MNWTEFDNLTKEELYNKLELIEEEIVIIEDRLYRAEYELTKAESEAEYWKDKYINEVGEPE